MFNEGAEPSDPTTPTGDEGGQPAEDGNRINLSGSESGEENPPTDGQPGDEGAKPEKGSEPGEIQYEPFNLPEGVVASEEDLGVFTNLAKEYGLDQEGAQKMVDLHLAVAQTVQKNAMETFANLAETEAQGWRDQIQRDAELGGKNLPQTQKHIDAFQDNVLSTLGISAKEFTEAVGHRGVHPVMVRMMSALGRLVSEDPVNLGGGTPNGDGKTPEQRMFATSGHV